ncbi:unnamed protein product [Zymoseptoria tritici ST99CH_1A5]|uniref:CBM1 domain-containing protein n=3 Tax=Zymoseptoria tritici TaxID=1047171 RepID=A0A1X7RYT3_ZYMT9|nr:unnamed protein product [Zymoseptoria tritici ST99CH_3D7]SMR55369.1 unnamed protein product [Zymoseptoria tritici ST99CH_1E4]SMR57745.1 unnamed protein product [Zymoseptoria tritici ST99CH_3D1]SMY26181.1 unnamed protein product [Zymoseptoria tritici ST99CH_1A5]
MQFTNFLVAALAGLLFHATQVHAGGCPAPGVCKGNPKIGCVCHWGDPEDGGDIQGSCSRRGNWCKTP